MSIPAGGDILIQRASARDASSLTTLAQRAKARWGYPPEWLDLWRDELTIVPQYIEDHQVFKALESDRIVGMCAVEDHLASWALEHVWVDPAHHRKGVGRKLVGHALRVVRELRPGIVTVASDPHAVDFYRRLGARSCGVKGAPMPGAPGRVIPILEFTVLADTFGS